MDGFMDDSGVGRGLRTWFVGYVCGKGKGCSMR